MTSEGRQEQWEALRREVAEIASVETADVSADTMLVGDLDFDSLAFAELFVVLVELFGRSNVDDAIKRAQGGDVSVGDLLKGVAAPPG